MDYEELLVPISLGILTLAQCTHPTMVKWIRDYEVEGEPIGMKVGGQWRVYESRLRKFLAGRGYKKNMQIST